MPDYAVAMTAAEDGSDKVVFRNDGRAAAPGWDTYMLEQEWRAWCADKDVVPRAPAQHFVKFCATWFGHRGRP